MAGFLVRRVVQAVIVVVSVVLIVFVLAHVDSAREARGVLGPRATRQQITRFNRQNGLTLPIWDQFWRYVDQLFHANLGYSYKSNQGVSALIANRLPKTLLLVGISTLLALALAIPLAVLQVARHGEALDHVLTTSSFAFYAMPSFLLGTLLIRYFALDLHWFPVEFSQSATVGDLLRDPRSLVLPELTLTAVTIAFFGRYARASILDVMDADFVRTARAKGATESRVLFTHVLRNALVPIVTLVGLSIPSLVSGAVITETVFNYPGMGLLSVQAALNADVPLLLGTTIVATIATTLGSLLADVLYAVVDPRIRDAR